jgi:hypothetical protein
MTIEEIDEALATWTERLQRVDENLLALEDEPTCRLLERTVIEGVTAARVTPALAAMRELFARRGLLQEMLSRVRERRTRVSHFLPSGGVLAEIDALLHGPSIHLPPVQTPLAQRGLLSAAAHEDTIRPDDLLAAMLQAFEVARDAVMAVDAAWGRLYPAVDSMEREVEALAALASSLGANEESELAAARAEIAALRERIGCDPLGVTTGLEQQVAPLLQRVRTRLTALAEQREQVRAGRGRAQALLQELRETVRACREAYERACREIADAPPAAPPDPALVDGLAVWLDRLDGVMELGHWPAAAVGLRRWLEAAGSALQEAEGAHAASAAPLAAREELLGRLSARKAQLRALQTRGLVFAPELEARALELEALLQQRPTPLAAASKQVAAFERQLAALARH